MCALRQVVRRELPNRGRRGGILRGVDNNSMDPPEQHGTVRQPRHGVLPRQGRRQGKSINFKAEKLTTEFVKRAK